MGNAAETTGTGFSFDALGKTWTLAPKSPGIRAKYSEWAKLWARARLREQRATMRADEYQEERELLQDRINKGDYDWSTPYDKEEEMGTAVAAILNGPIGRVKLTQLMLEQHHGPTEGSEIAKMLADNPDDFNAAWRDAMGLAEKNNPTPEASESTPPTGGESNASGDAPATPKVPSA